MTLHLTLKMTTAQVVETSVTNSSLFKDYLHPDDHVQQISDTPGFKPFYHVTAICGMTYRAKLRWDLIENFYKW